jgi:hypothetical protein
MVRLAPMPKMGPGATRKILLLLVSIEAVIIIISGVATYIALPSAKSSSQREETNEPRVELSMHIDDVQPSSGEALATIWVKVYAPRHAIGYPSNDSNIVAKFRYDEQSDVILQFEETPEPSSGGELDYWASKPASVSLSAYGPQHYFPIDHYTVIGVISLTGRGSFSIINGDPNNDDIRTGSDAYPIYRNLSVGKINGWRSISPVVLPGLGHAAYKETFFEIDVSRPASFSIFVFAVALLPLMIALAFVGKARDHQSSRTDSTSPLELAAALLALLALRQVLTPTNVSSITLLDRILAAELALILLLTLFVYLKTDRRRRTMKPVGSDGTDKRLPTADFLHWTQLDSGLWVPPVPSSEDGGHNTKTRRVAEGENLQAR